MPRTAITMTWADLLFLHWRVDPAALRPLIPEAFEIDTFAGDAYVALVPFRMAETTLHRTPPAPGMREFYECNVRTYVKRGDRAGVWFFSLDAQNLLPVVGGRLVWKLNYVHARFAVKRDERTGRFDYALTRRPWGPWPAAHTRVAWIPGEPLPTSAPGTLEHFLTERYWLFTMKNGRPCAGRVHHEPWPLRNATLHELDDTLVQAGGVRVPGITDTEPLAWASDRVVVTGEPLVRV